MDLGDGPGQYPAMLDMLSRELHGIRALGLLRLHEAALVELPGVLARSTGVDGRPGPGEVDTHAVEEALRRAVDGLDPGQREVGRITFGLLPGTRALPAKERRNRAAGLAGISVDRFRKHQEKLLIRQVAAAILAAAASGAPGTRGSATGPGSVALAPASWPSPETGKGPTTPGLSRSPVSVPAGRHRVDTPFPHGEVTITLHVAPIELIEGVDVLVSSENVYFEMSKTFRRTVSGSLRRAGAKKDAGGRIVDDVIAQQLRAWSERSAPPGLPVAPGTVAVTSAGALAAHGVRRIFHAAVTTPCATGNGYETAPEAVAEAVRRIFDLAGEERDSGEVPLRSVALPLFGAGRGGLSARRSAEAILGALEVALAADPDWSVHLVTRNPGSAGAVLDALAARRR
ncbi:macro domain-containing protein [Streptomyces sp. MUM 136J]|uniref:macro domain-containing protein n=1 Tax=Streptomyces sp. MUM 136J TaxID=2791992 RepID=UPI001F04C570|nr:macro domain-containing protein [Streptomyces sp. MUM 136J]MCH0571020.1 macro domain-containing protein [Streptomyces sp. MUM 136J]